jgi:glycosyltransferase involved in cell wall biosynthesis
MDYSKYFVSIVMNCHNGEKFITRSIDSILNQSHTNFEIIFYDNQSTDNTYKIIKDIQDRRIKYFRSVKYLNLYEARNEAIKLAKGEFIAFLDVDDTWEKKKLELQIQNLIDQNSDVCFTNYWVKKNKKKKIFKKTVKFRNIRDAILNNYPIGILTVLMNSKIFSNSEIIFNKKYEIIGDFDLFYRLSQKVNFSCIDKPLATYNIHNDNLSIKKIDLEIKEFDDWILNNKLTFYNEKNSIIENQNIRICNFLFNKKKLFMSSSELKKILNFNIRLRFYIKLIIQKLRII